MRGNTILKASHENDTFDLLSLARSLVRHVVGVCADAAARLAKWEAALKRASSCAEYVCAADRKESGSNGLPLEAKTEENVEEIAKTIEVLAVFGGHLMDEYDPRRPRRNPSRKTDSIKR